MGTQVISLRAEACKLKDALRKPGPEWNTLLITLDGPRTIVYLNDQLVTDYRVGEPVPPRKFDFEPYPGVRPNAGYFGLQNHGDDDVVYFKEVSNRPLKK